MSFDTEEWLSKEVNGEPIHKRLCFLTIASVGAPGSISHEGPGGHQLGLTPEEAAEFTFLSGVTQGLEMAGIPFFKIFAPYLERYVAALTDRPA